MTKLPKQKLAVLDTVPTGVRLRERLDELYTESCAVAAVRWGGQAYWSLALLELARIGLKHEPAITRLIVERDVDPAVGGGQAFALAAVRGDIGMLKLLTDELAVRTATPESRDEERFALLCNRIDQQLRKNPACASQRPDPDVLDAALR